MTLDHIQATLDAMGRIHWDIPNVVRDKVTAVDAGSVSSYHNCYAIIVDVFLANEYGKLGPGSKHYSGIVLITKHGLKNRVTRDIYELVSNARTLAIEHVKKNIAEGKHFRLADITDLGQ